MIQTGCETIGDPVFAIIPFSKCRSFSIGRPSITQREANVCRAD